MFSSKKKQNELLRAKISSLIGKDTLVKGDLNFSGGLHIVGEVNGKVSSDDEESLLIISENATVKGDINVRHLIVNGQVDGNVSVAGKVELFDKALINGDIHYYALELPVGAQVNGKLIHMEQSKKKK